VRRLLERYQRLPPNLSRVERHWFRVALLVLPAGTLAHVLLLGTFASLGLGGLALLNVGSVAAWVIATVLLRAGALVPAVGLVIAELVVHAFVVTLVLGADAGFPVYMLTLPSAAAMAPKSHRGFAIGAAVVGLAAMVGMVVMGLDVVSPVPEWNPVFLVANLAWVFVLLFAWSAWFERLTATAETAIARANERNEELLHNILPVAIAERLKESPAVIADRHPAASVLFADIVGFTVLADRMEAAELVALLDDIFTALDDRVDHYGLEKIKTIGDAYMVASGVPESIDDHAGRLAAFAIDMVQLVEDHGRERGVDVQLRVGIHSGPVVAGVIGRRKFAYDLWGDAVNVAARMESHGIPGQIQVSEATRRLLERDWRLERRGTVQIKGKGEVTTWLLRGRRGVP